MSGLISFLKSQPKGALASIEHLNMVHTANGEDFLTILEAGEILASPCAVFKGEDIAYFFLGRPCYKTHLVDNPSHWQLPAVFIFSHTDKYRPVRAFPFDSGAFYDKRFEHIIGRLSPNLFAFDGDAKTISEIISVFFGDARRYEQGKANSYESISKIVGNEMRHIAPLALAKLYNYSLNDEIDDRSKVIELQFPFSIRLDSPDLKAIICCKEWLRDKVVKNMITRYQCKVLSYPIFPLNTSSYYSKIYELSGKIK